MAELAAFFEAKARLPRVPPMALARHLVGRLYAAPFTFTCGGRTVALRPPTGPQLTEFSRQPIVTLRGILQPRAGWETRSPGGFDLLLDFCPHHRDRAIVVERLPQHIDMVFAYERSLRAELRVPVQTLIRASVPTPTEGTLLALLGGIEDLGVPVRALRSLAGASGLDMAVRAFSVARTLVASASRCRFRAQARDLDRLRRTARYVAALAAVLEAEAASGASSALPVARDELDAAERAYEALPVPHASSSRRAHEGAPR